MQSLVDTYNQHVSSGKIQREEEQERLLTKLDALRVIVEQKQENFCFLSLLLPQEESMYGEA